MHKHSQFTLHTISAADTLPIRHQVLWPSKTAAFCQVEGDEQALHFGVRAKQQLVCVASLYLSTDADNKTARLRKFATLETFQQQGIGSMLMQHMLDSATALGVTYFWCDARESASRFYQRFGLATEGERFYKSDVAYFKMGIALQ